jgi:hypothetical protein
MEPAGLFLAGLFVFALAAGNAEVTEHNQQVEDCRANAADGEEFECGFTRSFGGELGKAAAEGVARGTAQVLTEALLEGLFHRR